MTTAVQSLVQLGAEEQALLMGDLKSLSEAQRGQLYDRVCSSLGLNPYTRPFDYLTLSGRLTLYAKKDATDQLRKLHNVSIIAIEQEVLNDVLFVTIKAQDRTGRTDMDMGAVSIAGLRGDALANATMKAITKGKRRVTLSICGLGMLDESEIETIPAAAPVRRTTVALQAPPALPEHSVNTTTGEVTSTSELDALYRKLTARQRALALRFNHRVLIPTDLDVAGAQALLAELDATGVRLKEMKASVPAEDLEARYPAVPGMADDEGEEAGLPPF